MARPIPLRPDPAAVTARSVEALTRTIIVEAQARIDKRSDEATLARERWPDDPLVPLMLRAATQPNALPNPALGTSIVSDLLTVVGATGAGAKLLQSGLMLTFDRHAAIFVPGLEAAADLDCIRRRILSDPRP